jgi:hypothetical protein
MSTSPVSFDQPRIGLREACLLLIAAGFAALMIDEGKLAVITGWAVVLLWLWSLLRGPRLSPKVTMTLGAGLFVTTFWWPEENWWHGAIALMWAGIAMLVAGFVLVAVERSRRNEGTRSLPGQPPNP